MLRRESPWRGVRYAGTQGPGVPSSSCRACPAAGEPIAQIAKDLGIAESGLRRWMAQADVDEGKREGLSTDEKAELVRLRRENRTQAMEIEILKRASAYFARENVLPNRVPARL